jgi:hypothetical protein
MLSSKSPVLLILPYCYPVLEDDIVYLLPVTSVEITLVVPATR